MIPCTCRAADVSQTDHVILEGKIVTVHGLHHCYQYTRKEDKKS